MTKHVLVTGGAGSVGQELALSLARAGHRVRVLDLPSRDCTALRAKGIEALAGDIGDVDLLRRGVEGVDAVVHLAALLPPASERDRDLTLAVNVEGTRRLAKALWRENRCAHLILASSVCVYGDTTGEEPPIRVDHPRRPLHVYAESKIAAEDVILEAGLPYTILRISGIAVPALLEPPAVWPFRADQRIEFVCRTDVVAALAACVERPEARGRIWNVAGGSTWRMRGAAYVTPQYELLGVAPEEARYSDAPDAFDWYDTDEPQAVLGYQQTPFDGFLGLLRQAVEEAFG